MTKAQTIQVLVKRPGASAVLETIPNTLDAMQALVGGYIEVATLRGGQEMIVNEEGKLDGLEPNFYCHDLHDLIVGTAFFPGPVDADGNFTSLRTSAVDGLYRHLDDNDAAYLKGGSS